HTRSDRDWSSDVCSSDLPPNRRRSFRVFLDREDEGAGAPTRDDRRRFGGLVEVALGLVLLERPGRRRRLDGHGALRHLLGDLLRSEERRVGKEWRRTGGQ